MGAMNQRASLTRSILLDTALLWVFHTGTFGLITFLAGISLSYLQVFLPSSAVLHVLLALVLLRGRKDFYNLESGAALEKVNLPTVLTMFRITSLPSMLVLLFASAVYRQVVLVLMGYMTIAFLSDMLDGYISRRTHQTTRVGQYLDSMSDYGVLVGVAVAFAWFHLATDWFLVAVLVRFLAQWIMAGILFLLRGSEMEARSSLLGKASVAGTMVVFGLYLLKLVPWFDPFRIWMIIPEVLCLPLLGTSLGEKVYLFVKELRHGSRKETAA